MKLYKYTGTISEVSFRNSTNCAIKLYDMNDRDKAPTRLEVVGALGKYIWDIEGTDAEERYIPNDFYFDDNLYLWRIEIPGGCDWPAKIITQSPDDIDQLEIFGEREYIETSKPKSMPVGSKPPEGANGTRAASMSSAIMIDTVASTCTATSASPVECRASSVMSFSTMHRRPTA